MKSLRPMTQEDDCADFDKADRDYRTAQDAISRAEECITQYFVSNADCRIYLQQQYPQSQDSIEEQRSLSEIEREKEIWRYVSKANTIEDKDSHVHLISALREMITKHHDAMDMARHHSVNRAKSGPRKKND